MILRSDVMFLLSAVLSVTLLCASPITASADNDPIPPFDSCAGANNSDIGFCSGAHDDAVTTSVSRRRNQQISQGEPNRDSSVDAQRAQETAEGSASSDAQAAGVGQVCDGVMRMYEKPDGTVDEVACLYFSAANPAGGKLALGRV